VADAARASGGDSESRGAGDCDCSACACLGESAAPLFAQPTQGLTTPRWEDTVLAQRVTALRQGPAAVGQTQLLWRHVRQPPYLSELRRGDARGRSTPTEAVHCCHAVCAEGLEIGRDGIDMPIQHVGDVSSRQPGGREQEGFGSAAWPGRERACKHLVELSNVGRLGLPKAQRPGQS
jgi:hypothetical protein